MAVPKRKTSPSRRGNRRSHDSIRLANSVECPNCGELKLSHHICSACGFYKNKEVIVKIEDDSEAEDNSEN